MLNNIEKKQINEALDALPDGHYLDGVYSDRYLNVHRENIGYLVFLRETDLITAQTINRIVLGKCFSRTAASRKVDEIDAYIGQQQFKRRMAQGE